MTEIRDNDLGEPAGVVSAKQELRLIRNLLGNLRHVPTLGIEAIARNHYTTFGALGLAIVTSPDLRKVVDVTLPYFNFTYAFSQIEASDTEHETCVAIDASSVPEDVQRFIMKRDSTEYQEG